MLIQSYPAFAIAGTGNADYTSGGTVVSTDDKKNFAEIAFTPPGALLVYLLWHLQVWGLGLMGSDFNSKFNRF